MKINILIIIVVLFIFTNPITTQNQHQNTINKNIQTKQIDSAVYQTQDIERIQAQINQLPAWIAKEFKQQENEDQSLQYGEYFILQLEPNQQQQFRWPLKVQGKQYKIQFVVYTTQSGDDFTYIKDSAEDQFVLIGKKQKIDNNYQKLGTVYVKGKFNIRAKDGIFIRLRNLHSKQVLVQIGLQGDPIVINPDILTKDQHFSLQAQKISAIHEQSKKSQLNRYRYYKTQWGFHQRQQHYESQMLTLTGIQLLLILVTSIVQMYCIKGLLDNQQVI